MANPNKTNPVLNGVWIEPIELTPDDSESDINVIPANIDSVVLDANVNGVNDFVVLPALASVPNGHIITILAGAANCELRTPASSTEEINSENCDGTKEYLITATDIVKVTKIDNTIGWMGASWTKLGAKRTAVVPD